MSAVPENIRQFVGARKGRMGWRVAPKHIDVFETFLKDTVRKTERGHGPFEAVKSGARKSVYKWNNSPCEGTLYLKIYVRGYWRYFLKYPPAEKEARAILRARAAGVGTSELIAFGKRVSFPSTVESLLLSASPSSAVTLGRRWAEFLITKGGGKPDVVRDLEALFPEVRKLHDCGISHDDMNVRNVLFEETDGSFIFIDFHRSCSLDDTGPGGRARDLLKLYIYIKPWFSWDEWGEILQGYFTGDSDLRRDVMGTWDGIEQELLGRRVNDVMNACLGSRHGFRRFTSDDMVIYSCAQFSPDEILRFVKEETGSEDWHAERYDRQSTARKAWFKEVRNCAEGNEAPIPIALIERGEENLLIRGGRRKAPYAAENRFSLEAYK